MPWENPVRRPDVPPAGARVLKAAADGGVDSPAARIFFGATLLHKNEPISRRWLAVVRPAPGRARPVDSRPPGLRTQKSKESPSSGSGAFAGDDPPSRNASLAANGCAVADSRLRSAGGAITARGVFPFTSRSRNRRTTRGGSADRKDGGSVDRGMRIDGLAGRGPADRWDEDRWIARMRISRSTGRGSADRPDKDQLIDNMEIGGLAEYQITMIFGYKLSFRDPAARSPTPTSVGGP